MTLLFFSEFSIEEEHDQTQVSTFPSADHASFPFPIRFNNPQGHPSQKQQLKPNEFMLIGGQSTDPALNSSTNISEQSFGDHSTKERDSQESDKWMTSKMRIMRKLINTHQAASNETKNLDQRSQLNTDNTSSMNNRGGLIRVCSDCNTTKTPLWRSGPRGPKSLCNACGIRQRKARRAIAAAAGILVTTEKPTKRRSKEKAADEDRTVPFKKRCRMVTAATSGQLKNASV